jgi:general secretion pathway protein G
MSARRGEQGITYLEVMATSLVVFILASAILPMAHVTSTRAKEAELRAALREIRTAINHYNMMCDDQAPPLDATGRKLSCPAPGFPQKLEDLVEGKAYTNDVSGMKFKALRRIPRDPMTEDGEWGLRCYEDEIDSTSHCGSNIWNVYSKSKRKALDGTKYMDW